MRLMVRFILVCILFLPALSSHAQNQLDGRPLDPSGDPDIDLFISSWKESISFNSHGNLTERFIMEPLAGDNPLSPARRGAVLENFNRISRATLAVGTTTVPTTLDGEQEILYFKEGQGIVRAGDQEVMVRDGVFVLVPEGLSFTIVNTGDDLLMLYLVSEPVPEGFTPQTELVVRDEKRMPYRDEGILKTHWAHNGKGIFTKSNGLATLHAITCMTFNAMTIGHPHSHGEGYEEVWLTVEGDPYMFLGKEIRRHPIGTAYKIPRTNETPHAGINVSEEAVKYLYISWIPPEQ